MERVSDGDWLRVAWADSELVELAVVLSLLGADDEAVGADVCGSVEGGVRLPAAVAEDDSDVLTVADADALALAEAVRLADALSLAESPGCLG
jgi:hypothetical protein